MSFIPKRIQESGQSLVDMFRASPVYKQIIKNQGRNPIRLVQSLVEPRANLVEGEEANFPFALMAKLVDIGMDRALVDVIQEGKQLKVYLSDRIGKLNKEIFNMVAEIADGELLAKAEDTGMGTYIYGMVPKDGVDFDTYIQNLIKKKNQSA